MRNLASIQKILKIDPIFNADAIEVATILGWHVVIKKGEFKEGDLVIYVEIDSILPETEWTEFMRPRHFKVKTIKLRGQISQGIAFPLDILPVKNSCGVYPEGADVTDILKITKYEPEQNFTPQKQPFKIMYPKWFPNWLTSIIHKTPLRELFRRKLEGAKTFPCFIPKTDETRVQVLQTLLDKYAGIMCYITEKLDGSSITCYVKDGKFGVCSRNLDLADDGNQFWETAKQMDIEAKLRELGGDYAIQGELIGEGIQGNKLQINGKTIRWFNVFDIKQQQYLDYEDFTILIRHMGLETVPVINNNFILHSNIDELVNLAVGKSVIFPAAHREGIVIRPLTETTDNSLHCQLQHARVSFKAINPEFLLRCED